MAGLTAAFRLKDVAGVVVLEAAARVGGQIWTELDDGFAIERGAEGFVFRSEVVPRLAADLGMPDDLIGQSVMKSYGFDGEALRELAPGEAARFLGFQVPREDLGKGIRSLRRGMGSLIWALRGNLHDRVELRAGAPATRVETPDDGQDGVRVVLDDGATLEADLVIVATNAHGAAELLQDAVGEPARALAGARTLSSVTVELAFEREQLDHPLDGTGFVVALDHQRDGMRAATFTTSKFIDRAPPGKVSVRCFFRPTPEDLETLDDGAWRERALSGLSRVVPVKGAPLRCWVTRWADALPVFDDAHRQRVAALERALQDRPVLLAGAAFHGSGIDAAVSSGERAAELARRRLGLA